MVKKNILPARILTNYSNYPVTFPIERQKTVDDISKCKLCLREATPFKKYVVDEYSPKSTPLTLARNFKWKFD